MTTAPLGRLSASMFQICAGVLLLLILPASAAKADGISAELEALRAAYVYNFAKYINWSSVSGDTLNLCLDSKQIDNSSFAGLQGLSVADKQLNIVELPATAADIAGRCHIWYVDTSSYDNVRTLLEQSVASRVLTIADALNKNAENLLVMHFLVVNNKLRFRINQQLARYKNLDINPALVRLAQP